MFRSPEASAYQRARWMRPDAERWMRPDAHRWRKPVHPDEQKYNPSQPRVPAGNPDGGQWTDADGAFGRPGYEGTREGMRVLSDADPEPLIPGAQYAQDSGLERIDLLEEERLGGHPVTGHVGKSDSYLRAEVVERSHGIISRGDNFRGLSVGSFYSLESANRLVNATIAANRDAIERISRGETSLESFGHQFGSATGYEARLDRYNAQPYMRDTYGVHVIVLRDRSANRGWRVHTAYPER